MNWKEDIVLYTDKNLLHPVRLMLFSYSKLAQESRVELAKLPLMPLEKQALIRVMLKQSPLNCFLQFDGDNSVKIIRSTWLDLAA